MTSMVKTLEGEDGGPTYFIKLLTYVFESPSPLPTARHLPPGF